MVNCSKPPDCCQRKVQSNFNGQLRKLKIERGVSLGSCWQNRTLIKTKRPSLAFRIPSENHSSNLCSTIFTSKFFVALDDRNLSISNIREVSEVNVKFEATWLKQWKKMAKLCSKCHSLLYIGYIMSKKEKTIHNRSCRSISFILKANYVHSKTINKFKSACLWKQLKWSKFPFSGDTLAGKNIHLDWHRKERTWRNQLTGAKSPDKATVCLEKLLWTKNWKTKWC